MNERNITFYLVLICILPDIVSGHSSGNSTHENETSIELHWFIAICTIIALVLFCFILIVQKVQGDIKLIRFRNLVIIVYTTMIFNIILLVNTVIKVKV